MASVSSLFAVAAALLSGVLAQAPRTPSGPSFGAPVITADFSFNSTLGLFTANSSAGYFASGIAASQFASQAVPSLCLTLAQVTGKSVVVMGTCTAPGDADYVNQLWFLAPIPLGKCGSAPCKSLRPLTQPTTCVGKTSPVSALLPVQLVDCSNSPGPGWNTDFSAGPSGFGNEYGEWLAPMF